MLQSYLVSLKDCYCCSCQIYFSKYLVFVFSRRVNVLLR